MAITQTTDFINRFHLSKTNLNTALLQDCIDRFEKKYLIKLLGAELYDLFIDGIEEMVVDPIWTALLEDFHIDNNGCLIESEGIKVMLLGFIYYEYVKIQTEKQTPIGNTQPAAENASLIGVSSIVVQRQIWSTDTYKAIQQYILLNIDDYPTFNGVEMKYEYLF